MKFLHPWSEAETRQTWCRWRAQPTSFRGRVPPGHPPQPHYLLWPLRRAGCFWKPGGPEGSEKCPVGVGLPLEVLLAQAPFSWRFPLSRAQGRRVWARPREGSRNRAEPGGLPRRPSPDSSEAEKETPVPSAAGRSWVWRVSGSHPCNNEGRRGEAGSGEEAPCGPVTPSALPPGSASFHTRFPLRGARSPAAFF